MSQDRIDSIIIHTESFVKGFFGEYRWLSNYHMCEVIYNGEAYTSSEAAYQAAKTEDEYVKGLIRKMGPKESRDYTRKMKPRKDWEAIKKQVMYDVLVDKFSRNVILKEKLLETGAKYLEETNYWNDTFWGVCEGKGKNHLGETLMKIRNELKLEKNGFK
jgi:ribA/ribD-fused uncharacterized protein